MHCLDSHRRFVWRWSQIKLSSCRPNGSRSVSSLTPLGSAFNSKPHKSSFFPRDRWIRPYGESTGLFQFPELTSSEGFKDLKQACASRSQELVTEASLPVQDRKRIVARVFDELSNELCRVADMAEFLRLAHPDREMAEAAEDACISVSGLVERLNTDVDLFESLRASVEDGQDTMGDDVDQHVGKLFLLDFYQCGIHLPYEDRQKVVEINDSLLQIGQHFAHNCHRPGIRKKLDLPPNIRHQFSIDGDNVILNGLPVDTPHDLAREAGYKIFYCENPVQEQLLSQMTALRHELALTCGYETFAHRAMLESLGGSPDKVNQFLTKLSGELKSRVVKDYDEMSQMKTRASGGPYYLRSCGGQNFHVWDVPFFSMQARNQMFQSNLSNARISEYFSLGVVMEGKLCFFFMIFGRDIQLRKRDKRSIDKNFTDQSDSIGHCIEK